MLAKMRSHTRGGASRKVGRMVFISCGSLARLSENQTGKPMRMGRNSITTRCAMCADGRNAMVESAVRERQHLRPHVDVGRQRRVAYQAHFRFTGGAGGEIQNRGIVRAAPPRESSRMLAGSFFSAARPSARNCSSVIARSRFAGQQNPMQSRQWIGRRPHRSAPACSSDLPRRSLWRGWLHILYADPANGYVV
jgi:hypothetical protein